MPAPIVKGGGDSFLKWKNFQLSRASDLGSGHTAYRRASLIDLYYMQNSTEIEETFLWMDGRMDGRTFETHFITSTLLKSRPKNMRQSIISKPLAFNSITLRLLMRKSHQKLATGGDIYHAVTASTVTCSCYCNGSRRRRARCWQSVYQTLLHPSNSPDPNLARVITNEMAFLSSY